MPYGAALRLITVFWHQKHHRWICKVWQQPAHLSLCHGADIVITYAKDQGFAPFSSLLVCCTNHQRLSLFGHHAMSCLVKFRQLSFRNYFPQIHTAELHSGLLPEDRATVGNAICG